VMMRRKVRAACVAALTAATYTARLRCVAAAAVRRREIRLGVPRRGLSHVAVRAVPRAWRRSQRCRHRKRRRTARGAAEARCVSSRRTQRRH
jgi:hypothetical protein